MAPATAAVALEELALGLVCVVLRVEVGRARVPVAPRAFTGGWVQLDECC